MTGSTLHNAIGLHRLQDLQNHFNTFMLGHDPPELPQAVLDHMQHRSDNEDNAVATFAGVVLPAIFPLGSAFAEDGPRFISGKTSDSLVEVSCGGTLRQLSDTEDRISVFDKPSSITEIKCPVPAPYKTRVQYTLPHWYVCLVLVEMKAADVENGFFLSYSGESMVVYKMRFDSELWEMIESEVWDIYDHPIV